MEPQLLKMLGGIAGIGGIALGVFLLLFRDVIRRKIFPKLTRAQGYRVILVFMVLTWSVAIFGVAAWWKNSSRVAPPGDEKKLLSLAASIWKVDLDTKGALVATREFPGAPGDIPAASLNALADWVSSQLGLTERKDAPNIRLKVHIPADLTNQKPLIQRTPEGKMEILLWNIDGGGKLRAPLSWEMLKQMKRRFQLEIRIPGSEVALIEATPGEALNKEMELAPATVSIGVEKFTGLGDGISERLCQQLGAKLLIKVVSPDMLETIRKEVGRHNEMIRTNPGAQLALRSLGVDYVITGSVQSKAP